MGHSQADKAESRERILNIAAKKIRESGIDSLSIGSLMKAANLTHGGFYGHFSSRDDLIFNALERAIVQTGDLFASLPAGNTTEKITALVDRYLSERHRDDLGNSCPMSALAVDVARTDDHQFRGVLAARIERSFEGLAQVLGGGGAAKEAAVSGWCTMVGALVLARVLGDSAASNTILNVARQTVVDLAYTTPSREPSEADDLRRQQ